MSQKMSQKIKSRVRSPALYLFLQL